MHLQDLATSFFFEKNPWIKFKCIKNERHSLLPFFSASVLEQQIVITLTEHKARKFLRRIHKKIKAPLNEK